MTRIIKRANSQDFNHVYNGDEQKIAIMKQEVLLAYFNSKLCGLDEETVAQNRARFGANIIDRKRSKSEGKIFIEAFLNPFVMILLFLAVVSTITDILIPFYGLFGKTREDSEILQTLIIIGMVLISVVLRFIQDLRSQKASEALMAMITTTATVKRYPIGYVGIPFSEVVVGDIVKLSAGDMVPADIRIIEAKDLFINEASLSGESEPVEKNAASATVKTDGLTYTNMAYMGSDVVSGAAVGIVVNVGRNTMFGLMAKDLAEHRKVTDFEKGISKVSWLLLRFMAVMIPLVFIINGITKNDWLSALLFAISIGVGLTPEMLPMITTTCLAKGAIAMSKEKVIVKRLDAIQNFGSMDILCTDKTGTITQDKVMLEYHLNFKGHDDERVLFDAYLNSHFQTGYKNLMDQAIVAKASKCRSLKKIDQYRKIDELPFDFTRRRLSVIIADDRQKTMMITKGAAEEMLMICRQVEDGDKVRLLTENDRQKILSRVDELNAKGFRVLLVAKKYGALIDLKEEDMIMSGFLAFFDPPKASSQQAISDLKKHGVKVKILTGDNEKVTKTICQLIDMDQEGMLLGSDIAEMNDEQLQEAVEKCDIFAKVTPLQKGRITSLLRQNGHVVGFLGDGINDASAMKQADIGISVDTAADIAKESADIIMLKKDLTVLEAGIIEGRKTYINMMKYIKITAASNFGNMFSVLAASVFLPFLPMISVQILLLNLIYDISCTAIPWDNVDAEDIIKPQKWSSDSVFWFMICFGPISSIFDFLTFLFFYFGLCPLFVSHGVLFHDLARAYSDQQLFIVSSAYIALFQAGWFVQSMWSQTLIVHIIRTAKKPFIESRPGISLGVLSLLGIAVLTLIPYTFIGDAIGLAPLPLLFFIYLIPCTLVYILSVSLVKGRYSRCRKLL